jgi:hypothetical protein
MVVPLLVEYSGVPIADTGRAMHRDIGQKIDYSGPLPPDSGDHWQNWVACGTYDIEVNDEFVVHNMEHGQVIISYNLPDREEAARLLQLAEDLPDLDEWGILRPYPRLGAGEVALTAWGVREQFKGVDEERVRQFYESHRANRYSPETQAVGPIPCSSSIHMGG